VSHHDGDVADDADVDLVVDTGRQSTAGFRVCQIGGFI
jgi:hypothetical protein